MITPRKVWIPLAVTVVVYILAPILVFDFSSPAVPFDEEYHDEKKVAIGPRPRTWIPGATHDFDVPGGFSYAPEGWPFVVWKPLCLAYLQTHGYEKPAEWRR